MIKTFPTVSEANAWMEQNSAWKPVTMMPGVSSGSLVMLFEASLPSWTAHKPLTESEIADIQIPKRRGRPPKVKDAV